LSKSKNTKKRKRKIYTACATIALQTKGGRKKKGKREVLYIQLAS